MKPSNTLIVATVLGLAAVAIVPYARHQTALANEVEARAAALAATTEREKAQTERITTSTFDALLASLPEAERLEIARQIAADRKAEISRAEAEAKEAKAETEAKAKQARLVKLAHEAAELATEVGVAEVSGQPVNPTKAARLKELQSIFNAESQNEIVALITARNGSQITRLVEGW